MCESRNIRFFWWFFGGFFCNRNILIFCSYPCLIRSKSGFIYDIKYNYRIAKSLIIVRKIYVEICIFIIAYVQNPGQRITCKQRLDIRQNNKRKLCPKNTTNRQRKPFKMHVMFPRLELTSYYLDIVTTPPDL